MSDAEVSEIVGFLLDCSEALREEGGIQELMLCLNRLYVLVPMMVDATPRRSARAERFCLAMRLPLPGNPTDAVTMTGRGAITSSSIRPLRHPCHRLRAYRLEQG
jgi:hypothetical protein